MLVGIYLASHTFGLGTISLALSLAPYLVLVGIGQMLVISAGPGNIDVSVGNIVSLAGFVSVGVTSSTGSVTLGLLAGAGSGVGTAVISVIAITLVRIPPIVATLASGLIASSFTLTLANGFTANPSPALRSFVNASVGGVPIIAIITALFTVVVVLVLKFTVIGRSLVAVGQNRRAAEYAGIKSVRVIAGTYLVSGLLAGISGALLATYIAPTADLGTSYLLDSIAVVVVGGTLISGGRAVSAGVWGGALFFILLDSFLNLIGFSLAGQNVLKGALVLAVLFLAGGAVRRRRGVPIDPPTTGIRLPAMMVAGVPGAVPAEPGEPGAVVPGAVPAEPERE